MYCHFDSAIFYRGTEHELYNWFQLETLYSYSFVLYLLPFLSNHDALCKSPDTSSHSKGASLHWYSTYCLQEPLYNLINADMSASVTSYVMFTRDARTVVFKLKEGKCEVRRKLKLYIRI